MAISVSIESPRPSPLIRVVGARLPKATISINLVALSFRTFSLLRSFTNILHPRRRRCHCPRQSRGRRRRQSRWRAPRRLLRWLLMRQEITPRWEPLPLMVPKGPLRQCMDGVLMTSDHAPFPIGLDAAVMVNIVWYLLKAIKPIYVCKIYYSSGPRISYFRYDTQYNRQTRVVVYLGP